MGGYLGNPNRLTNGMEAIPETGGDVTGVTITDAGTGGVDGPYNNTPAIGGSGTGLTIDITIAGNVITVAAVNAAGTGYIAGEVVTVDVGGITAEVLTLAANAIIPAVNFSPKTGSCLCPRSNVNPFYG